MPELLDRRSTTKDVDTSRSRGHRYLAKRLGGHGDELLPEAAVGLLPVREDGQDVPHLGVGRRQMQHGDREEGVH